MPRLIKIFVFLVIIGFVLPGMPVYSQNQGQPQNQIQAQPQAQQPAPAGQAGKNSQAQEPEVMTNIHDIKPPEPAGFDPSILWYVLAAVAALAIIGLLIFLWKRRTRRIKLKTTPSLLPEEAALLALDELLDVENINGKDFYFRLSSILRHYINDRYEINAPEMTTEELLPKVDRLGIDKTLVQSLRELFHASDPVKFAGVHSVASRMENDLAFGRKFVKETTTTGEIEDNK